MSETEEFASGSNPGEEPHERYNRELIELLNELRIALPGVQVLFGFLLTVPLTDRFPNVNDFERTLYSATLVCTALSLLLLITPTAYHRINFRQRERHRMLKSANKLVIAGVGFLALAMTGSIAFITSLLYGDGETVAAAVASAVLFASYWFLFPWYRRVN